MKYTTYYDMKQIDGKWKIFTYTKNVDGNYVPLSKMDFESFEKALSFAQEFNYVRIHKK